MAFGLTVSIEGLDSLQSYVSKLPTELKNKVDTNVSKVLDEGYNMMREDCPVRTGRLKRSINKTRGYGNDSFGGIDITAPYAGFVNFGTYKMKPNPFVTNAYNFMVEELYKELLS